MYRWSAVARWPNVSTTRCQWSKWDWSSGAHTATFILFDGRDSAICSNRIRQLLTRDRPSKPKQGKCSDPSLRNSRQVPKGCLLGTRLSQNGENAVIHHIWTVRAGSSHHARHFIEKTRVLTFTIISFGILQLGVRKRSGTRLKECLQDVPGAIL